MPLTIAVARSAACDTHHKRVDFTSTSPNETPPEQPQTGGVSRSPVGDILRERAPGRLAREQGGQSRVETWAK
jgi:hypothetical protein